MNLAFRIPEALSQDSFKAYLFNNRTNKVTVCIAAVVVIIQFVMFKYFYPYADYVHEDSFVYLDMAYMNPDIGFHMVGYSKFLRLFSVLTSSDTALVASQYLLVQSSAMFLLFTVCFFYGPEKVVQIILLCLIVLNPLFLYIANLVSSDAFFLSLSLTWFALLLWIVHRPSTLVIVWHILVLFVAFTVRYNALIYPTITMLAFLLSKLPLGKKLAGIGSVILLCGFFILYTGSKYKALTGTWQYAPLGGWLVANNAVRTYRYVDSTERKPVPAKFKALDNVIRTYFDSSRRNDEKMPVEVTLSMYPPHLFLNIYRDLQFKNDSAVSDLKKWATVAPLFTDYGLYVVGQYPTVYVQHFLLPSITRYYIPPVESLASYNSGRDTVASIAQSWFGYKSNKIATRNKDLQLRVLESYPVFSGGINVVMLGSLTCFVMLNGLRRNQQFRKGLLLAIAVLLLNAGLTIFATMAVLRFQAFPIMITAVFTLLVVDSLWKIGTDAKNEGQSFKKETGRPDLAGEKVLSIEVAALMGPTLREDSAGH